MKQFMAAHPIEMLDMAKADHAHRAPELGATPVSTVLLLWLIMLLLAAPDTTCWFVGLNSAQNMR